MSESLGARLSAFLTRPVAERAASPLKEEAEIGFAILSGITRTPCTFKRVSGKNQVTETPSSRPDLTFEIPEAALAELEKITSEDVGEIGIEIGKLIVASDPKLRIHVRLETGFLTLWNRGYLGVMTGGGAAFASFLASKGLNGLDGIKSVIQKLRSGG